MLLVRKVVTWRGRHRLVATRTAALCHLRLGRRLELFGSATRSDFNPARSDHDCQVSFDELPPAAYCDASFSLKKGLDAIFERPMVWWSNGRSATLVSGSVRTPHGSPSMCRWRQQGRLGRLSEFFGTLVDYRRAGVSPGWQEARPRCLPAPDSGSAGKIRQ